MATPSYKLIYFGVQARAELARMLFRYANVDFEDVRITRDDWATLKQDPKTKFGQVPILEINGKPIAQSQAIVRYLAQKFGYLPTDPDAALPIDELYAFINSDISDKQFLGSLFQDPEAKEKYRSDYFGNQLPTRLGYIEKILESSTSGYLVGDKLTLADLALIDFAQRVLFDKDWIERTKPVLEKLPKVSEYLQKRFEDPQYKAYLEKKPKA